MIGDTRFWLEITSIAEDQQQFKKRAAEERLETFSGRQTLPLSLVRKLHRDFPGERSQSVLDAALADGPRANEDVANPWNLPGPRMFHGITTPHLTPLFDLIGAAVAAKAAKDHEHKWATVLVIDNRTSAYDEHDMREAATRFGELRAAGPFPEVWLYTGFYSDDNGNNAEFVFSPVLLPDETRSELEKGVDLCGPDQGWNRVLLL